MILSASRRTDIPCYYGDWFMNRVRAGYACVRNPMNSHQVSRVPLGGEVVDCIVFWSKDPAPFIRHLPELDRRGYHYYFQFTVTPYGRDIEKNLRDKERIMDTFCELSARIGSDRLVWRYDPVIVTCDMTPEWHEEQFARMCERLAPCAAYIVYSFADPYAHLKKDLIRPVPPADMRRLTVAFAGTAAQYGKEVRICCEDPGLLSYGAKQGACIDRELIERITGAALSAKKDRTQRPGCSCCESVDIGAYDTCLNGCVYCYAKRGNNLAEKNYRQADRNSEFLTGSARDTDQTTDRKCRSELDRQILLW